MRNAIRVTRIQWYLRRLAILACIVTAMAIGLLFAWRNVLVAKAAPTTGASVSTSASGGVTIKFSGITLACVAGVTGLLNQGVGTPSSATDTRLITITNTSSAEEDFFDGSQSKIIVMEEGTQWARVVTSAELMGGLYICGNGAALSGTITIQ